MVMRPRDLQKEKNSDLVVTCRTDFIYSNTHARTSGQRILSSRFSREALRLLDPVVVMQHLFFPIYNSRIELENERWCKYFLGKKKVSLRAATRDVTTVRRWRLDSTKKMEYKWVEITAPRFCLEKSFGVVMWECVWGKALNSILPCKRWIISNFRGQDMSVKAIQIIMP